MNGHNNFPIIPVWVYKVQFHSILHTPAILIIAKNLVMKKFQVIPNNIIYISVYLCTLCVAQWEWYL